MYESYSERFSCSELVIPSGFHPSRVPFVGRVIIRIFALKHRAKKSAEFYYVFAMIFGRGPIACMTRKPNNHFPRRAFAL